MNDAFTHAESQFRDAARQFGIELPSKLDNNRLQRFNPETGNGNKGSGWCIFHSDGLPAGAFGNWATDVNEKWVCKPNGRAPSQEEWQAHRKNVECTNRALELEEARQHKRVAKETGELLKTLGPAPDYHPYLLDKHVHAHGLLLHDGKLFMPLHDEHNAVHSYQTIDENGDKLFPFGGRKEGLFYLFGAIHPEGELPVPPRHRRDVRASPRRLRDDRPLLGLAPLAARLRHNGELPRRPISRHTHGTLSCRTISPL
jgi:putative DNA primase/helicase